MMPKPKKEKDIRCSCDGWNYCHDAFMSWLASDECWDEIANIIECYQDQGLGFTDIAKHIQKRLIKND